MLTPDREHHASGQGAVRNPGRQLLCGGEETPFVEALCRRAVARLPSPALGCIGALPLRPGPPSRPSSLVPKTAAPRNRASARIHPRYVYGCFSFDAPPTCPNIRLSPKRQSCGCSDDGQAAPPFEDGLAISQRQNVKRLRTVLGRTASD
jgi:hypothetical protein